MERVIINTPRRILPFYADYIDNKRNFNFNVYCKLESVFDRVHALVPLDITTVI